MKRTIGILAVLLLTFTTLTSLLPGRGDCDGEEEYNKGLQKLGDFRLIDDFRVSLRKGKSVIHPVSLTRGLTYKFYPVNHPENSSKMIMTIYMKSGGQMKLASTHGGSSKHYPYIKFECGKSGKYYLEFKFDNEDKGCGVGMFTVSK